MTVGDQAEKSFQIGNVVRLKSGGTDMVILEIAAQSFMPGYPDRIVADCQWFEGDSLRKKRFSVTLLDHVN